MQHVDNYNPLPQQLYLGTYSVRDKSRFDLAELRKSVFISLTGVQNITDFIGVGKNSIQSFLIESEQAVNTQI